jgi:ligand-binding sensor domain-containing protein
MSFNNPMKILSSTIGCLFLFSVLVNGQTYSFKNIGAEKGLPNGFIYEINQSPDGFLWVGTGNGLFRFDGFDFFNVPYPDSITSRYTTVSLKDKNGTLWFGCSDGSVFYTKENKLVAVPMPNSKSISVILEGPDGFIYIIPQGKTVITVNPVKPEEINNYYFEGDPVIFSASFTYAGNLLVGTQENILLCRFAKDSVKVESTVEGFDYTAVTAIHQTDDSSIFVLGTDGNGLFQLKLTEKGNFLSRFSDHPEWNTLIVKSITEDFENSIWVSTFESGVIQFELSNDHETTKSVHIYNIGSGLNANNVEQVFQDIEGNYWFGFFGEGLSLLTSYSFSYYTPGKNPRENNILFVQSIDENFILGTPSGFHIFDSFSGKSVSFTDLSRQVGNVDITSYYLDKEKNLWIGTDGNGLFVRSSSGTVRRSYKNGDSGLVILKWMEAISGLLQQMVL